MNQFTLDNQKLLSIDEERIVARTFMGRIEWEMIVIGLGQFLFWLGIGDIEVRVHSRLYSRCVVVGAHAAIQSQHIAPRCHPSDSPLSPGPYGIYIYIWNI